MPRSVRQLLDDAEADILMRMDPVRKELTILERELADVRKAKNAINSTAHGVSVRVVGVGELRGAPRAYGGGEAEPATPPSSPYAKLTMKQLVRKALEEHFANGATANELLAFFANAWGRHDIIRTSLSPQLSRLKREGVITLRGMKWHLAGQTDIYDQPNENGAPTTLPLDAPKADGGATPSNHQPPTTNG